MTIQNILSIIFPLIAIFVAIWQGFIAKNQLEQSKETKSDTEKLLDEIKAKVAKIEQVSDETRQDVKNNISKIIDKQDENLKLLLNAPNDRDQNAMMEKLLPTLLENDGLEKMIALSDKINKNTKK